MEKLNIAKILKDCPKGMELDCTICDNVYFDEVTPHMIKCFVKNDVYNTIYFHHDGTYLTTQNAKCVIFPKGKTTWEGFQIPFKDGDIVATEYGNWIGIVRNKARDGYKTYFSVNNANSGVYPDSTFYFNRFATEEEKQKLFDAIKVNGYKWDAKTKTLEKLIEPKFKVGDKVKNKDGYVIDIIGIDTNKEEFKYKTPIGAIGEISFNNQNNYELVPNKFDITTLIPFDKVLVRDLKDEYWNIGFFSFK